MKTFIKFLFTLLILFAFSCSQETTLDPVPADLDGVSAKANNVTSTEYIIDGVAFFSVPSVTIKMGTSTLHRSKNGITVNFKAENLYPAAYTIWWVVWNNPGACEGGAGACGTDADFANPDVQVVVLNAGGHVVGNNGKGNITGHLKADDASGLVGLEVGNTFKAEVHVVLRSHGPAIPGMVNEQISSYGGGCLNNIDPPFSAYPMGIGECGDLAFAIHPPEM